MSSKRPPACTEKAYIEIDLELLKATGEIRIIGSPIVAPTITQRIPRGKFEITYTAELFDIMKTLGNKKIEVLSYILDHKDGNNCLNITNTELAEVTNTSRPTVIETINILREANLITRKNSVIMVSPGLMVKGNQLREAWLMRKYEEVLDNQPTLPALPEVEVEVQTVDAEIDEQYAFTHNGEIVRYAK